MFQVTTYNRRGSLRLATVAGVGVLSGIIGCAAQQGRRSIFPNLFSEGSFPSLSGATTWLNSPPLTPQGLRGKVVIVQFWTYTCINWLRTLPYSRAWAEKYKDKGLVVIGAHTPEFSFEHNLDNIRLQAKNLRVNYPIAVDSDNGVWNAFNNNYWPALYLIDAEGKIRYHHFGEGEYEQTEMLLKRLLREAGNSDFATLNRPNGRIAFRFHARDVNLVMGPAAQTRSVPFRVLLDGQPAGAVHGTDVDAQGNGTLSEQRTYQLIRQSKPIADRLFEIEFLEPGAEAYCFTFG